MAAVLYFKMAIEFIFYFEFQFEFLTIQNVNLDTKKMFLCGLQAKLLRKDEKYGGNLVFQDGSYIFYYFEF